MVEIIISIGLLVLYMSYLLVVGVNTYKRIDRQDKAILGMEKEMEILQKEIKFIRSSIYIVDVENELAN